LYFFDETNASSDMAKTPFNNTKPIIIINSTSILDIELNKNRQELGLLL
jgi:hypothetical protein